MEKIIYNNKTSPFETSSIALIRNKTNVYATLQNIAIIYNMTEDEVRDHIRSLPCGCYGHDILLHEDKIYYNQTVIRTIGNEIDTKEALITAMDFISWFVGIIYISRIKELEMIDSQS